MQTPVTVVMLLHDIATETDRPVCKVCLLYTSDAADEL